jgi:hypothetical protein
LLRSDRELSDALRSIGALVHPKRIVGRSGNSAARMTDRFPECGWGWGQQLAAASCPGSTSKYLSNERPELRKCSAARRANIQIEQPS